MARRMFKCKPRQLILPSTLTKHFSKLNKCIHPRERCQVSLDRPQQYILSILHTSTNCLNKRRCQCLLAVSQPHMQQSHSKTNLVNYSHSLLITFTHNATRLKPMVSNYGSLYLTTSTDSATATNIDVAARNSSVCSWFACCLGCSIVGALLSMCYKGLGFYNVTGCSKKVVLYAALQLPSTKNYLSTSSYFNWFSPFNSPLCTATYVCLGLDLQASLFCQMSSPRVFPTLCMVAEEK